MKNIAVILPINKADYLANCVVDGLISLSIKAEIDFRVTSDYPSAYPLNEYTSSEKEFVDFAKDADLVVLIRGKLGTNIELAEKINQFDKTVFVDGSEVGKNNRFDFELQYKIIEGTHKGPGAIDERLLSRCALYFKREKPYGQGVVPFPFGISASVLSRFDKSVKKDIDFVCIFGQDEYPLMRRYSQKMLKEFCRNNNFVAVTEPTAGFQHDEHRIAGRDEFYGLLSRAKVGISIGGGGFDTVRFWELLGSNCLLLTEKIDIYEQDSHRLKYDRIWEFANLFDFEYQLEEVGAFLKEQYDQDKLLPEYQKIIAEHSTEARVSELIKTSLAAIAHRDMRQ